MEKLVKLHPSWLAAVGDEFDKPYMQQLKTFLLTEKQAQKIQVDCSFLHFAFSSWAYRSGSEL